MEIIITTSQGSDNAFGNGKPVSSDIVSKDAVRHLLEDGRYITVKAQASYRIDYESTWVGAKPGDTYSINVSLIGKSKVSGFYEVWNYDVSQVKSYKFAKTLKATCLKSGETYNTAEFEDAFNRGVKT